MKLEALTSTGSLQQTCRNSDRPIGFGIDRAGGGTSATIGGEAGGGTAGGKTSV
jgi:hypothetical protein